MPREKKTNVPSKTQSSAEPKIPKELLDQLIAGPITQGEFEAIYRALKKAIIERAMSAKTTEHLGHKHGEPKPVGQQSALEVDLVYRVNDTLTRQAVVRPQGHALSMPLVDPP